MTEAATRTEGKAVAVENGGQPWTIWTDRIDVGTSGVLELCNQQLDLMLEPASGQAPWSRGQVEVIADVSPLSPASAAVDWFYLEVNVIGLLGQVKTVIGRFAFGPDKLLATLDLDRPYEKITFESRQVISDAEGPVIPYSLGFMAFGRFYR